MKDVIYEVQTLKTGLYVISTFNRALLAPVASLCMFIHKISM